MGSVEIQSNIQSNKKKHQSLREKQQSKNLENPPKPPQFKDVPLSQSSSSGLTIQEFLSRYPEVKRLSSRFNEEEQVTEKTFLESREPKNNKFHGNTQHTQNINNFAVTTQPTFFNTQKSFPIITPKQKKLKNHNKFSNKNKNKNKFSENTKKDLEFRKEQERKLKEKEIRERERREKEAKEREQKQKEQKERERLRKQKEEELRQQRLQEEREERERKEFEREQRLKIQREKEFIEKQKREEEESRRQEKFEREQKRKLKEQEEQKWREKAKLSKKNKNKKKGNGIFSDYYDPGVDYDYDYYYDQLVPEHERFFQLPNTVSPSDKDALISNKKNSEGFAVFTHFSDIKNNQKTETKFHISVPTPPPPKITTRKPKERPVAGNSISGSSGKHGGSGGPQAGPYGYTNKGTFFTDDHYVGFPEQIEMIYQGFVWAFTMFYPDQPSVLHGGVHKILKDKVKTETVDLRGDYIVRVTGRASPYNINRLTFYTKNGKQWGPWGDRHSEESIDFDVSAPPGQALAYFSGTIDFGVPLRFISFHWRPMP